MSWSYNKLGRAGKLAEVVKQQVAGVGGCPKGSAEESAKNQVGEMLETLVKSLPAEKIVKIDASGSAWNQSDGSALSQSLKVELTTVGDLVE
jgi:hypothetical protein